MFDGIRNKFVGMARAAGVDSAVGFTAAQRVWAFASAPITLLLVARGLSPTEQGYYYAFASVLGVQILFELGLIAVVVQFASHEMVSLGWGSDGRYVGSDRALGRMATLLRGATRWYAGAAALTILAVFPAGAMMFARRGGEGVTWVGPWLWVVLVSAGRLLLSPVFAVLEGCGLVAAVARNRTTYAVAGTVLLWVGLLTHRRLYAVPVNATVQFVGSLIWLAQKKRRQSLTQLATVAVVPAFRMDWRREVWPMQWRLAVSMVSSYFIYQMFVPILFAVRGPIEAGQMGMSTAVVNTLTVTGLAWVTTKAPQMGGHIAKREFGALDELFFRALKQSMIVVGLGGAGFWGLVVALRLSGTPIAGRLLSPLPLGLLVLAGTANHVFSAQAAYLRAHRQEPFARVAVLMAVTGSAATYVLGRFAGATGMMAGYLVVMLVVGIGCGTLVFNTKRREWHGVVEDAAAVKSSGEVPT